MISPSGFHNRPEQAAAGFDRAPDRGQMAPGEQEAGRVSERDREQVSALVQVADGGKAVEVGRAQIRSGASPKRPVRRSQKPPRGTDSNTAPLLAHPGQQQEERNVKRFLANSRNHAWLIVAVTVSLLGMA